MSVRLTEEFSEVNALFLLTPLLTKNNLIRKTWNWQNKNSQVKALYKNSWKEQIQVWKPFVLKTEFCTKSDTLLLGGRQAQNQRNGINIPVEKRAENGVCNKS